MEKKLEDFSREDILRLAESPAGQQLIAMLRQQNSATLQQAVSHAQTGNFTQAAQVISAMLSSPQAQKLLKELGGT